MYFADTQVFIYTLTLITAEFDHYVIDQCKIITFYKRYNFFMNPTLYFLDLGLVLG